MEIPRATYRFQFCEHFRLTDARRLVPWLHSLGISHIYASPLTQATPHSAHGYDVCDFTRLNPEIGTEAGLKALADELRRHDMGLVLDIVPNHMGIGAPENQWWQDVLRLGRRSKYAGFFDINWDSPDPGLRGKVLLPVLGDEYEHVLERGELRLQLKQGRFALRYFDNVFPLSPDSTAGLPKSSKTVVVINSNRPALDGLIQKQNYRLAFWREGDSRLNYRRFFSIASLAGLRMEVQRVFAEAHQLIKRWLKAGWLDGLRVDHPDGLRYPAEYLERLRALAPGAWIVVEKILMPGEWLPETWPVAGTTGYDFLNAANGLFVVRENEAAFTKIYADFTGESADYPALVVEKKRAILRSSLAAEVSRLAGLLEPLGSGRFTAQDIRQVLVEFVACFPVYRTYIRPERGDITEADRRAVERALFAARKGRHEIRRELLDLLGRILLEPQADNGAAEFVARLQQLTGAAMAKGAEDTAFYCYNRFLSLNEVGGDPGRFGVSLAEFHYFCAQMARHWPATMLASSTHDTKRSEDVRARLNVLSEIPDTWNRAVRRWSKLTAPYRKKKFPDRNAEYFFYQTLVGAWPVSEARITATMEKAAREAKQFTNWNEPNQTYEAALKHFVKSAMNDAEFTAELENFVAGIQDFGRINSLAQTLLKLTAPGVPDIYQGNELWDFSLVDPDNRRPVDFPARQKFSEQIQKLSAAEAWNRRDEGVPKLWLIQKVLGFRAQRPEAFGEQGNYEPLFATGAKAQHLVLFQRGGRFITAVPRFLVALKQDWADTTVELPRGTWRNVLAAENFTKRSIPAGNLFRHFPVALLQRED